MDEPQRQGKIIVDVQPGYQLRYGGDKEIPKFSVAFRTIVEPLILYNEWARKEELRKYSPEKMNQLLLSDPQSMLLAWDGDEIAGFLVTRPDDGPLWLSWFGVLPNHRGKGLADQMIRQMLVDASKRNYWKVWCDTREENTYSIAILEKNGFRLRCRLQKHWYGQDFLIWERFLDNI